jgi:hypothetical protein
MAKTTSDGLRRRANRIDAIALFKNTIAILRTGDDAGAHRLASRALSLIETQPAEQSDAGVKRTSGAGEG